MHIGTPPSRQRKGSLLGSIDQGRVNRRIRVNRHRAVASIRRGNDPQTTTLVGVVEALFLVARLIAGALRQDPDLQQMRLLVLRRVELTMLHTRAGAHPLHVAVTDRRTVAHAVAMGQRALEHIGDDLHVAMSMGAKTLTARNTVFVDHA